MKTSVLLCLTLALTAPAEGLKIEPGRKRNPWAPSLPLLTKDEEATLDRIINRFILADIGQLRGVAALEAKRDFDRLGPEATFALIRGLNRAAKIQDTCPVLVISRKLTKILRSTQDGELLEFAKDNIGVGVGATRHAAALRNIRFSCQLRMNALARLPRAGTNTPKPRGDSTDTNSTEALIRAASAERGPKLRAIVLALAGREGKGVLTGLGTASTSSDPVIRKLALTAIEQRIRKLGESGAVEHLQHEHSEVQKTAIRIIIDNHPKSVGNVIDLLEDDKEEIRFAARKNLVYLNKGRDLGPGPFPTDESWKQARKAWSDWWNSK